jgi:peptidyl-prolyl cis-trans isomerase C
VQNIFREPLFFFLLAGAVIFAVSELTSGPGDDYLIAVTDAERARISDQWRAQMGRAPTDEELAGLVEQWVREEIYYREALRMGLDRNDVIIRRRLAQKLTFLTEDVIAGAAPSTDELEAYFEANSQRYRIPERFTFRHRYFSTERRPNAREDAAAALADETVRGDPFMLQKAYALRSSREIGDLFGADFADGLARLTPGSWQGPIRSAYGWHVVLVEQRAPARLPSLEDVQKRVAADLSQERRRQANEEYYRSLRQRYEIIGG